MLLKSASRNEVADLNPKFEIAPDEREVQPPVLHLETLLAPFDVVALGRDRQRDKLHGVRGGGGCSLLHMAERG